MGKPVASGSGEHGYATGIGLAVLGFTTLSLQDVVTKLLVQDYPIAQFLMVRFWATGAFALVYAARNGGIGAAVRSGRPLLQLLRSGLMIADVALFTLAVRYISLADFQALYATAPLMATLLAASLLGESVGWRRRSAVAVGFLGALVIVRPGSSVLHWASLLTLATALCWAFYSIVTRVTSRSDSLATSTLYLALTGMACFTPFGIIEWIEPDLSGALSMLAVTITGIVGHMLLIKAFEYTPAAVLQPYTYLMLVWAVVLGYLVFGDVPDHWTVIGALVIAASGLYVAWRERVRATAPPSADAPSRRP